MSFFLIMSKIAEFFGTNVLSRSRIKGDKHYFSFMVICSNKTSLIKTTKYFNKFPLLSSKYLDFKDWYKIFELQTSNSITTSYLDIALSIRRDFNSTRTSYNWNHLINCYLKR